MDMNNLLAFIEVADKKSFSRSAESLKLTQPAVSKRIAALESELASRLFDRVGRTVHLTEAGRVLLPSALKINSEVARIEQEICNLGKEVRGKLSIGAAENVDVDRLAPLLKMFREKYPDVEIDLNFGQSQNTLTDVENGILDMGLCSSHGLRHPEGANPKLRSIEVWNDQLKVVAEKKHPLFTGSNITVKELAAYPAILPMRTAAVRQTINNILASNEATATVSLEASDFHTMKSMAAIGLGWTCLPESDIDESLAVLPVIDMNINCSVALVRSADRSMSRAAQAFVDSLPALLN